MTCCPGIYRRTACRRDGVNWALTYLWLVDGRSLVPSKDLRDKAIYRYGLLSLWEQANPDGWLNSARRNGLVETITLVDRLRLCGHCGSAHLNYIDNCPHCGDIDIAEERAIHCFTCGHVSSQERFLRLEKLVCPNCLTQLRHIGVDYDRPIENHRCKRCNQMFIDAKVVALCLSCGQRNEVDQLRTRNVHSYGLGHEGYTKVREGRLSQPVSLSLGEPLGRAHFLWMLQWLNLVNPISGNHHVVLALHIANLNELINRDASERTRDHLDELSLLLRGLLNPVEFFTRFDDEAAVVILPLGGPDRVKLLSDGIGKLAASQLDNEMEINLLAQELPCIDINVDAARWLEGFVSDMKRQWTSH